MKPTSFAILLLLFVNLQLSAQPGKGRRGENIRERISKEHTDFINERLALAGEEAAKFWSTHSKFNDELESLKRQQQKLRNNTNDKLALLSEKDIDKALEDELQIQQRMLDIQREYEANLKKIIGSKKVVMLQKAERDFKMELLKRLGRGAGGDTED